MPAVRIAAADTGYPLPVIAAGEKVLSNCLDPFEAKLPECIGIFLIINSRDRRSTYQRLACVFHE
jgi:hypothetical protein